MPVGHPRKQLAEALAERLPKTWRIVPGWHTFDPTGKTTVVIKQGVVSRTPAAPIGIRTIEFTLTLMSRYTSVEQAEDDLDARLAELLAALDSMGIKWSTATPVSVDEKYLGYDIAAEINTKKENL